MVSIFKGSKYNKMLLKTKITLKFESLMGNEDSLNLAGNQSHLTNISFPSGEDVRSANECNILVSGVARPRQLSLSA